MLYAIVHLGPSPSRPLDVHQCCVEFEEPADKGLSDSDVNEATALQTE